MYFRADLSSDSCLSNSIFFVDSGNMTTCFIHKNCKKLTDIVHELISIRQVHVLLTFKVKPNKVMKHDKRRIHFYISALH